MEKVLYLLEQHDETSGGDLVERLLTTTAGQIREAGGKGIQINVVDDAVAPAAGLRFVTGSHAPDAMVSVWLPSAIDEFRAPVDLVINQLGARTSACLVTESQPIISRVGPDLRGRTPGFAQVAFLHRPQRLTVEDWLDNWLNHHTRVAIDTQATFGYTQNIVTRWLFDTATNDDERDGESSVHQLHYDAIVEELFPEAAMTDQFAFYNADGDEATLERNRSAMMSSVGRFIDLDRIDVMATSQYRL